MNIAKNYLYNVLYQVFILIVPLITIPYVSRVLGSNGVGINAYTNSIIQYFVLFGSMGIALYGNRSIAYVSNNKDALSKTFWSIFILKLLNIVVAFLLFLFFILLVDNFRFIFLIQSIYILSAAMDITWLYMGLEDFRKTVLRNLFVKVIGIASIFVFVKTDLDLWKYVLILASSEFIGQLTMWFYLPKTVDKIRIKWVDIQQHIKPSITLFIPQIAIQIYLVLNKTLLGLFSNTNEVGYFDNADKIVKMVIAIVTALGVVMLPRISSLYAKGDNEKVKDYIYLSFDFVSYLSIPIMFGLASISSNFTLWFFGPEFTKTSILIYILCPVVVFISWSSVLGTQYLLATGSERQFTISVSLGAIVDFMFNLILIKYFQSIGTAVSTLIAELTVTLIQFYFVNRHIKVNRMFNGIWKYLLSGLILLISTKYIGSLFDIGFLKTMVQIISGGIIYFIVLCMLKSETNKKIFGKAQQIIKKVIKTRNF